MHLKKNAGMDVEAAYSPPSSLFHTDSSPEQNRLVDQGSYKSFKHIEFIKLEIIP